MTIDSRAAIETEGLIDAVHEAFNSTGKPMQFLRELHERGFMVVPIPEEPPEFAEVEPLPAADIVTIDAAWTLTHPFIYRLVLADDPVRPGHGLLTDLISLLQDAIRACELEMLLRTPAWQGDHASSSTIGRARAYLSKLHLEPAPERPNAVVPRDPVPAFLTLRTGHEVYALSWDDWIKEVGIEAGRSLDNREMVDAKAAYEKHQSPAEFAADLILS